MSPDSSIESGRSTIIARDLVAAGSITLQQITVTHEPNPVLSVTLKDSAAARITVQQVATRELLHVQSPGLDAPFLSTRLRPVESLSTADIRNNFGRLVSLENSSSNFAGFLSTLKHYSRDFKHPLDILELANQIPQTLSEQDKREQVEFRRFVKAVLLYEDQVEYFRYMPDFTWSEVSCWRVFFLAFPQSFGLLSRLFVYLKRDRGLWEQYSGKIRAALLLTSAIANAEEHENILLPDRATNLIRGVRNSLEGIILVSSMQNNSEDTGEQLAQSRALVRSVGNDFFGSSIWVNSYSDYLLVRQYLFARAEAEGERSVRDCVDFIERHNRSNPNWERRLLEGYYGMHSTTAETEIVRIMEKKLISGKQRDIKTKPITSQSIDLTIRH